MHQLFIKSNIWSGLDEKPSYKFSEELLFRIVLIELEKLSIVVKIIVKLDSKVCGTTNLSIFMAQMNTRQGLRFTLGIHDNKKRYAIFN